MTRTYTLEDPDCDNLKSIRTSIEECIQIFQVALKERDNLTLLSAKDAVVTSKEQLKSAVDFVKGVINKTEHPALQPRSTTGLQRSIEIKSKKLLIHFEYAVHVLRSLQQDSPSTDARLSEGDVEKIVHARLSPLVVEVPRLRETRRRSVRTQGPCSPETLAGIEA